MTMPSATANPVRHGYRPDIDGLRAVAVLLVLLDHLKTRVRGGFIGVDVFFVISGYLIGGHILTSLGSGNFSFLDFYERRVRRIFPALVVVLATCCALAWRFTVPTETAKFAASLLAALFSWSNMFFLGDSNYFALADARRPLLHTWSLGVEEQFYIVLPILFVLLWRFARTSIRTTLWTLLALSFAAACWYTAHNTVAAFYLLPLRAWELLAGTVLSQGYLPALRHRLGRECGAVTGLVLIVWSAFTLTSASPFPGWNALPACLGAVLLIAAGEHGTSLVGTALSLAPVVFVGRISYSLYLWHWPVIVFGSLPQFTHGDDTGRNAKIGFFVVSLVLATLSWALVEQPFRTGKLRPRRPMLFGITGTAALVLAILGSVALRTHGFASRFSPEAVALLDYPEAHANAGYRYGDCFVAPPDTWARFRPGVCLAPSDKPELLLLGDSLAAHLYPGLAAVYPDRNITQITAAGCQPFVSSTGNEELTPDYLRNCRDLQRAAFGDYLLHHQPALVLLAGTWKPSSLPDLGATVQWLHQHGQHVAVMGPIPDYDSPLPTALAWATRAADPEAALAARRRPETRALDAQMKQLAAGTWHVAYVSPFETLCAPGNGAPAEPTSGDGCPTLAAPGVPLQSDWHHFTEPGSVLFAKTLRAHNALP